MQTICLTPLENEKQKHQDFLKINYTVNTFYFTALLLLLPVTATNHCRLVKKRFSARAKTSRKMINELLFLVSNPPSTGTHGDVYGTGVETVTRFVVAVVVTAHFCFCDWLI